MHSNSLRKTAILLGLVTLTLILLQLAGCALAKKIDAEIWKPPAADPNAPNASAPPPIAEGIAAVLASIGYGGMALWIRRSSRNGNAKIDDVARTLAQHLVEAADPDRNVRQ